MASQSKRQNDWWMLNYSWRGRLDGGQIAPMTSWYCTRCFSMPQSRGGRRQSIRSAEAANMACLSWTPEADVFAIQLVGPQTSREEFESLYYEVYKLWRLPGSPSREPELVEEVVASLEDCQGWERGKMPQTTGEAQPNWSPALKEQGPQEGQEGCLCG